MNYKTLMMALAAMAAASVATAEDVTINDLTGAGTKVQVKAVTSWGFRATDADVNVFYVQDGASFETTSTNRSFVASAGSTGTGRNVYMFSGEGTTVTLRGGVRRRSRSTSS